MRFQMVLFCGYLSMKVHFQFSLWDSRGILVVALVVVIFQFSLWDSLQSLAGTTEGLISFQFSLWDSLKYMAFCILELLESLLSILFMRFDVSERMLSFMEMIFQFSLWDSKGGGNEGKILKCGSFNSLYEIPKSIFQSGICRKCNFQFSLWDSNFI